MQVKDLIKIVNVFDANIIFDKPEDVTNNLLAGRTPVYFAAIEGTEQRKYENLRNKQEFRSTTAAIHISDLSVRGLVNIFECDATGMHEFTKKAIEPYLNEGISMDVVYVIFLFLHEVGHWMQLYNMDRNVFKYANEDLELEKENSDKVNFLKKQQQERIKRGSECILTYNEKKLFEQYMKEYRCLPKEKDADEFALSKIQTVLELYKNSLSDSNGLVGE